MMRKKTNSLLLVIALMMNALPLFAAMDSIGLKEVNGELYIIHQVEKGEGLFMLSRKYKRSIEEIQKANTMSSTALKLGEELLIPTEKASGQKVHESPQGKAQTNLTQEPDTEEGNTLISHKVQRGETLFAIARKYQVSVTQIKEWNRLTSTNLSVGQLLKIDTRIKIPANPGQDETLTREVPDHSKGADVRNQKQQKHLPSIEVNEEGMASWLDDMNLNPNKSIALHKTAPIGTIIRVTNKMNNKSVYVKVIGALPPTGDNENTLILLSKTAAYLLDVKDPKFRAALNYSIAK